MEYLLLVFLHVTFGVFWAGGAVMVGLFVIPSIAEAGPAGGAVMAGVAKRRLPVVLLVSGVLTVLTGLRIYFVRFSTEWLQTPEGLAITTGAILALIALTVGITVSRPTAGRAARLAGEMAKAGGPPTPDQKAEMQMLQRRLGQAGRVVSWALVGAVVLMASHRFLTIF
jgi:hypothetical protein